jgi:hypothetical protein
MAVTAGTFRAGIKNKVVINPGGVLPIGLVRADVKIVAAGSKSRGALIVGDCTHKGRTVLALVPKKQTLKTLVSTLSTDGRICVTATVTTKLEITVRRAWTADDLRVTVIDPVQVFDSASTGRVPARNRVYKVRFTGLAAVPATAKFLLLRISGTAEAQAVVESGKCGRKRTGLVTIPPGQEFKSSEVLRLDATSICISATTPASLHIDVIGWG